MGLSCMDATRLKLDLSGRMQIHGYKRYLIFLPYTSQRRALPRWLCKLLMLRVISAGLLRRFQLAWELLPSG